MARSTSTESNSSTEKAPRRSKRQIAEDALNAASEKLQKARARVKRAQDEVNKANTAVGELTKEVNFLASHPALQNPTADDLAEPDGDTPETI